MRARRIMLVATAVLAGALCGSAPAQRRAAPWYPIGYRGWTVAKFKLVGPESPNYEKQGGFRHHFANDIALASWGRFADGAVIVDERMHAMLDAQRVWQADALAHVAVMRKDRARYAATGGWYFNLFTADDTTVGLTPEAAKAACFDACHAAREAHDFVFSDPRR